MAVNALKMERPNKKELSFAERGYMQVMKVATAISIIKNTPPELTAREYTEKLSMDYEKSQHIWKSKYETAEAEILNLRQQMLIMKTTKEHIDKWNFSQDEVTDMEVLSNSEPLFPTPPSSWSEKKRNKSVFFHKNTIFLQSIISIKRTLAHTNEKQTIQEITKQTILQNMEIIKDIVTDDSLQISLLNLTEGIKCVVELSDILYGKDYRDVHIKVNNIIEGLVSKVLSVDGLDQVSMDTKERFQQLIISFTETEHLNYLAATINILMTHCEKFCDKLRESQQEEAIMDCVGYENLFYVIQSMLICVCRKTSLLCSPEGRRLCESLQHRIDNSLLHITEKCPLVTHSMWKISGILQNYLQETTVS